MKLVREAEVRGKRVLVRCDLDVPIRFPNPPEENRRIPQPSRLKSLNLEGFSCGGWGIGRASPAEVLDDFRIRMCLPTLEYLVGEGAKVIICGHWDRPKGRVVSELRMDPVAEVLSEHLEAVHKADEVVGPVIRGVVEDMEGGDILLLENLRFHPGEEKNDPQFSKDLAELADLYVNEAFAVCHREHASVVGVTKHLLSYAGLRLEEEIEKLTQVKDNPRRPLVFIIGGAKSKTKVPLVKKISTYADKILLGGKLMFERSLEDAPNVIFPVDAVGIFDIGPQTVEMFKEVLEGAGTVVWNGPLGKLGTAEYAEGTRMVADFLTRVDAEIIVGGGDTLAALKEFGLRDKIDFVSTGGGAMLAFLAGEPLPGIEAL